MLNRYKHKTREIELAFGLRQPISIGKSVSVVYRNGVRQYIFNGVCIQYKNKNLLENKSSIVIYKDYGAISGVFLHVDLFVVGAWRLQKHIKTKVRINKVAKPHKRWGLFLLRKRIGR